MQHYDLNMLSSGSLHLCPSVSLSLCALWPQKPNYRRVLTFQETIISHTAKIIWSPQLFKQYKREGKRKQVSKQPYNRDCCTVDWVSSVNHKCRASETRSTKRDMTSNAIHSWRSRVFSQQTCSAAGSEGKAPELLGDQIPHNGSGNTLLPPCGYGQMTLEIMSMHVTSGIYIIKQILIKKKGLFEWVMWMLRNLRCSNSWFELRLQGS